MQPPLLVYLYGPPASGKLTVAEELRDITGFRLFHNHLTVNVVREVLDFGTPGFAELVGRMRIDVFATAIRAGTSLIFTNSSAWGAADGDVRFRDFADRSAGAVHDAGGTTLFVHLTAPAHVLEARLGNRSRCEHGKLVDVGRLRELLAPLDDRPLKAAHLSIDTARHTAREAAARIAVSAALPSPSGP